MQTKRRVVEKHEFLTQLERTFLTDLDHFQGRSTAGHNRPDGVEENIGCGSFTGLFRGHLERD
jgi:hypothetical protein